MKMKKKTAILIISGNSDQAGLAVGNTVIGSGEMGRVDMKILSFKHQIQFSDQPFVLEVKTLESTWFDDAHPITSISYNHYRNSVDVSTCTFTS